MSLYRLQYISIVAVGGRLWVPGPPDQPRLGRQNDQQWKPAPEDSTGNLENRLTPSPLLARDSKFEHYTCGRQLPTLTNLKIYTSKTLKYYTLFFIGKICACGCVAGGLHSSENTKFLHSVSFDSSLSGYYSNLLPSLLLHIVGARSNLQSPAVVCLLLQRTLPGRIQGLHSLHLLTPQTASH